jgi:hypothetical protein
LRAALARHTAHTRGDDMATILDLLMALNQGDLPPIPQPAQPVGLAPAPTGNVPEYGGPSQVVEPPQAPLDTRLIQQMLALRGPAPTPPAPAGRGTRIANAAIGFGQGLEGRGGQFLQQLQEPQRQYQRQLENYNQQGTELGMRGLETAQRQQEQKTRRAQEVSDREFEAELKRETRRLNLTDDREKALFADALLSRRQREDDERQAAEQRRKEDAQQKRDARVFASQLGRGPGAAPAKIAEELGNYYAKVSDSLSPAAKNWLNAQARRAEILARPPTGGGGPAASRREVQDLQRRTAQAVTGIAGMEKLARQAIEAPEANRAPILNQMRSMATTLQAQFPELLEVGEHNGWPFARLRLRGSQTPGQQQPQQKAPDPLGVR